MTYIYDIETYPNLFLIVFFNIDTKQYQYFQIQSEIDNRIQLAQFLNQKDLVLIGFNNLAYDNQILVNLFTKLFSLPTSDLLKQNKLFSDKLIQSEFKTFNKEQIGKQIDLFKLNHYDNKAKHVSLKELEFNFNIENIQELPYSPNTILTKSQIEDVIEYCHNDVYTTYLLYQESLPEIILREKMTSIYHIDFTNYNSTKIGETILVSQVEKELGYDAVYDTIELPTKTKVILKQSPITSIHLSDIVFDYISFTEPEFNSLLNFFKSKTITSLEGAFSKILLEDMTIPKEYYTEELTSIKDELGNKVTVQATLNIFFHNLTYYYGTGGIHACTKPGIYISDSNQTIIDFDVSSFYPNLAIHNHLYPKHYGKQFCNIYNNIYLERKKYPKHTAENLAYKLALNGSYGKSNSKYSPLYSPEFTVSITVNGQLLLSMFIERILCEIPNAYCLQANTDGATFSIPNSYIEKSNQIAQRWMKYTNLELESTIYSKMVILNVSNYIAIKESGDIKRKGTIFIYKSEPGELELYKNHSLRIVPYILEKIYSNPEPITDKNILEFIISKFNEAPLEYFYLRTKLNRDSSLSIRTLDSNNVIINDVIGQRISRYIVSGEIIYDKNNKSYRILGSGNQLIKIMKPLKGKSENREINIEAGYLCTVLNDLSQYTEIQIKSLIYKPYYIDKILNVVNQIGL